MGRLVLGRPGPVTHKEERGKKREKEERKKERRRKKRKGKKKKRKGRKLETDMGRLFRVWALYVIVYKALNITVRQ